MLQMMMPETVTRKNRRQKIFLRFNSKIPQIFSFFITQIFFLFTKKEVLFASISFFLN